VGGISEREERELKKENGEAGTLFGGRGKKRHAGTMRMTAIGFFFNMTL
jgi:hypothetical protein